ncbi:MAG: hypothetical protein KJ709_03695 [Nanoarchaeota archaeon]|nr:hypothetical protein [Nanoarchaeota archaeon]
MVKKKREIPGKVKIAIWVLIGLIILTIVIILVPSECERKKGTCRKACLEYEHPFDAGCGLESMIKTCCHPMGDCDDDCHDPGLKVCEASGYKECGEFDDDPCIEWSLPMPCDFNQSCYRGECSSSNRGQRCMYDENCTSNMVCKDSGRYGMQERYCCYDFECASILDPAGICVIDGGRDLLENGTGVLCKNGNWSIT